MRTKVVSKKIFLNNLKIKLEEKDGSRETYWKTTTESKKIRENQKKKIGENLRQFRKCF